MNSIRPGHPIPEGSTIPVEDPVLFVLAIASATQAFRDCSTIEQVLAVRPAPDMITHSLSGSMTCWTDPSSKKWMGRALPGRFSQQTHPIRGWGIGLYALDMTQLKSMLFEERHSLKWTVRINYILNPKLQFH